MNALVVRLCVMCVATRDPERGWDHNRVKGVVAKLVRVKDPTAATALEVAAGGRLYQVCKQRLHLRCLMELHQHHTVF